MAQDIGDGCIGILLLIVGIAIGAAGLSGVQGSKSDGDAVLGMIGIIVGTCAFSLGIHLMRRK